MTIRRLTRCLTLTAVLLAALWLAGLIFYVGAMDDPDQAAARRDTAQVDAIVVLTGGSERIATGINLLQQGLGKKLFISGVARGVDLARLRDGHALSLALRACCVVLGHQAGDTIGNAAETLAWLRQQNYRSFRLVTAHYHMARSLLEFRMLDPEITIVPHPVSPARVHLNVWWGRLGTARLLTIEYNKLLLTMLRFAWRARP